MRYVVLHARLNSLIIHRNIWNLERKHLIWFDTLHDDENSPNHSFGYFFTCRRKATNRKNTYLVPLSIQERKVIIGCYHSLFMELLVTCQDCKLSLNKCKPSLKSCKLSWKDIIIFLFVARNMLTMDHVETILNVIVEIQLAGCNTAANSKRFDFLQCCSSVF